MRLLKHCTLRLLNKLCLTFIAQVDYTVNASDSAIHYMNRAGRSEIYFEINLRNNLIYSLLIGFEFDILVQMTQRECSIDGCWVSQLTLDCIQHFYCHVIAICLSNLFDVSKSTRAHWKEKSKSQNFSLFFPVFLFSWIPFNCCTIESI